MDLPFLHAKAKEELFCFIIHLIGYYLLKENCSSVGGPTVSKFISLCYNSFQTGVQIQQQQ